MIRTTSPIWNLWVFIVDPPVAAPPARAARSSRGARAPRAPRTSAGAAPTLRAARAAARRPRRESIRPSSARAPLVRAHPLVEAARARLQRADVAFALELLDDAPRDLHAGEPDFVGEAGVRSVHGWLLAWGVVVAGVGSHICASMSNRRATKFGARVRVACERLDRTSVASRRRYLAGVMYNV